MPEVTKDTYDRLLENRPFKLNAEESEYGPAEGEQRCDRCVHFFTRKVDSFTVCEVVRPDEEGIEAIQPGYKCMFWTDDGENYPLLAEESA
jgi:hypothetical protein